MKTYNGTVVSEKMSQTIVVEVARDWVHPIYKKTVKRTKKYPVHDEQAEAKLGDKVEFIESRPYSKTVHFKLTQVLVKASPIAQAMANQDAATIDAAKKA